MTEPTDPLGAFRIGSACPEISLGDVRGNAGSIADAMSEAAREGVDLLVLPELSLTGYSLDDLHLQAALLESARREILRLAEISRGSGVLTIFGAPVATDGAVYNCAVFVHGGRVLGIVPKTYLPTYREYYERRQFASALERVSPCADLGNGPTPFGEDLVFPVADRKGCVIGAEVCEDMWAPVPPSSLLALAGATIIANLSASNITIGKAEVRDRLCSARSAGAMCAYAYSAAGFGESTTDLAWDGQAAIYELGDRLAQGERFRRNPPLLIADADPDRIVQDRMRNTTFRESARVFADRISRIRRVPFEIGPSRRSGGLRRPIARFPFVPDEAARRDSDCYEAYSIQVQGLQRRIGATRPRRLVIGVSGGLDSTQALLVAARAMDLLGRPRSDILGVTLPGFATSDSTRENAIALMLEIGAEARTIDIRPLCEQIFRDIGHPYANGAPVYDTVFENVQAGARTDLLFRLANQEGGFVLGTGDLSELALGWCTYGVGDHMSHYNVNSGVPKTLIRHLISWSAGSGHYSEATAEILQRILATEISPELVPPGADGALQSTEAAIGPYDLHDFFLFHMLRYGAGPLRLFHLAEAAWGPASPAAASGGRVYSGPEIAGWLEVFVKRFFASQFKRSVAPNGPKTSAGGSLSPRGDWRAPSDASPGPWLEEIAALKSKLGIS